MFRPAAFRRPGRPPDLDDPARRTEFLRDAGFSSDLADTLGRDQRYELNALLQLGRLGCPPELAARILAPLEEVRDDRT